MKGQVLKALSAFTAKERARYDLNAVRLRRHEGKATAVATDGRAVAMVTIDDSGKKSRRKTPEVMLLQSDLVARLRNDDDVVPNFPEKIVTVGVGNSSISLETDDLNDAPYPSKEIEGVFTEAEEHGDDALLYEMGVDQLLRIAKFYKRIGASSMRFRFPRKNKKRGINPNKTMTITGNGYHFDYERIEETVVVLAPVSIE